MTDGKAEIGILGGGISGLSLASFLTRKCEVLEADATTGGLARTYHSDGFSTDVGGHIMFSKNKPVLELMVRQLGDNVALRRRNNRIAYKDKQVKYPFENGLGVLDKEDLYDCLIGFLKNDAPPPPHPHFAAWMYYTFGKGITDRYLLPYNRKIWKLDPASMGIDWVERVPRPPMEDVVKSALGIETEGYTHQLHFHYPKRGGIQSLVDSFAADVATRTSVVTGYRVTRIRKTDAGWVVNDEREYEELASSIPLESLLAALPDVPAQVTDSARELRYNAVRIVMLGIDRREGLDEMTALYVPDEKVAFHRVCFNCTFSPDMAPAGCAALCCEITTRPDHPLFDASDDELYRRCEEGLRHLGVLRPEDRVVARLVRAERLAYVVCDLGYGRNTRTVLDYLTSIGVHTLGRLGRHQYVNMDACVAGAQELASVLDGTPRRSQSSTR